MKDADSYNYPTDFANSLREIWGNLFSGDYTPPPLPSDHQLRLLLDMVYLASMETDEDRRLKFTICVTPESFDVSQFGEDFPIEVWPFETDREVSIQEIRRLAAATDIDSSSIWVRFPKDEHQSLIIHGLVNFGSSWAYARKGFQYHHDQIPHVFLVRAEGPGKLLAYQGRYRAAALIAGKIVQTEAISLFDLGGVTPIFSEARDLLREKVIPPKYEIPKEWHQFEWTAVINVIFSIVNSIQQNGHGGALIMASQSCDLDDLVRIKYRLSAEKNDLQTRFVHFLNLRHRHGDMVWPAQFKPTEKEVPEEEIRISNYEVLESQRRLTESCFFVGNLAGVDGAIILGTDLKVKGFGAEILLQNTTPSNVFQVPNPMDGSKKEEEDSESFGMRHRSAMRLCGTIEGLAAFVVSQDGDVSLVWNAGGVCCYKSGIQTTNANMVLA